MNARDTLNVPYLCDCTAKSARGRKPRCRSFVTRTCTRGSTTGSRRVNATGSACSPTPRCVRLCDGTLQPPLARMRHTHGTARTSAPLSNARAELVGGNVEPLEVAERGARRQPQAVEQLLRLHVSQVSEFASCGCATPHQLTASPLWKSARFLSVNIAFRARARRRNKSDIWRAYSKEAYWYSSRGDLNWRAAYACVKSANCMRGDSPTYLTVLYWSGLCVQQTVHFN